MVSPTPHLDKLNAALRNGKVPEEDKEVLKEAIERHTDWIQRMLAVDPVDEGIGRTVGLVVEEMTTLLNEYKMFIDLEVVFDSPGDFLYRQKGQLKLDNTVIEEFLPYLISKAIPALGTGYEIGPKSCFSAIYFQSSLGSPQPGGGLRIKQKDQDFAISKKLYVVTSHSQDLSDAVLKETYLGYVTAECKTNLDKTMFQEAASTAHDVKSAVPGAKYYLLCEWLDMTPISTAASDIDEVLILRKAKRLSSNIRKNFSSSAGRIAARDDFAQLLQDNPFNPQVLTRFVHHIIGVLIDNDPTEDDVLESGFF